MGVNHRVFASEPERDYYYKLRREWGPRYNIYHNLPFLNVFSISKMHLNGKEQSRLKKTSIDYTLCDGNDSPLVCIEFDGLFDGVNIGSHYVPARQPDSEWREEIFSLKLKVAHISQFPFFIVGNDLFQDLSTELKLTVVDGIIGEVLARRASSSRLAKGFDPEDGAWSTEAFEALDPGTQHDIIQDWVIGEELIAELEHNPVSARGSELACELGANFSVLWRHFPEATECPNPFDSDFDFATFKQRIREIDSALHVGATVTLHSPDRGDIERTVMLPHFKTPGFGAELGLASSIAELLCLDHLRQLRTGALRVTPKFTGRDATMPQ